MTIIIAIHGNASPLMSMPIKRIIWGTHVPHFSMGKAQFQDRPPRPDPEDITPPPDPTPQKLLFLHRSASGDHGPFPRRGAAGGLINYADTGDIFGQIKRRGWTPPPQALNAGTDV